MTRLVVDPVSPDPAAIERARMALRSGGIVAVPTDTLYGLAVDPFNAMAVARIFALKGRRGEGALPLVAADTAQVRAWIGEMGSLATRLAETFWPGPLTLVMSAPSTLAPGVTGDRQTVGVRVPAHVVTRALCAAFARRLPATGATRSGEPATDNPAEVAARLADGVDVLLDAGPTPGGRPSTIVDVTGAEPQLIRSGAVSWDDVQACVHRE